MRRNDIKLVTLESINKSDTIKLVYFIKQELINRYGTDKVSVYIHDVEVETYMAITSNYGKFLALYKDLKKEMDTLLNDIKKKPRPDNDIKEVHLFLPNIISFISANAVYNSTNYGKCCNVDQRSVLSLRTCGLYGLSCDNTQMLDVFDDCKYKNYDFDRVIRCSAMRCDNDAEIELITRDLGLSDYVVKYLLRKECPDSHLNGREYRAMYNWGSDQSLQSMAEKIVDIINLYGVN